MTALPDPVSIRQQLAQREAELHEVLRAFASPVSDTGAAEAGDFKDLAVAESQATVDEAQAAQALAELEQLHAARRRLAEGRWGVCDECGDPIDPRRLQALPATPYCAACQQVLERQAQRALA